MELHSLAGTRGAGHPRAGRDGADDLQDLSRGALLELASRDLDELGRLADGARRERAGENVYYNVNRHIEPTNICRIGCTFCSFARHEITDEGAFRYTAAEILERTKGDEARGVTEYHLVGGVDAALGLPYYLDLIRSLKRAHPTITVKALSAVEIGALAWRSRISFQEVLTQFREAGADGITGGGAEIFAPRVREVIAGGKITGAQWLEIHETAHRVGLFSTATMLYGHLETMEERIDHILAVREVQERTGGFRAFIPLPFVPQKGTPMENHPAPPATEFLRMIALSRLALGNFPTIKAYWPAAGITLAHRALSFGANDLDGTVTEETIYQTFHNTLSRQKLEELIREAGRIPVER